MRKPRQYEQQETPTEHQLGRKAAEGRARYTCRREHPPQQRRAYQRHTLSPPHTRLGTSSVDKVVGKHKIEDTQGIPKHNDGSMIIVKMRIFLRSRGCVYVGMYRKNTKHAAGAIGRQSNVTDKQPLCASFFRSGTGLAHPR